MTYFIDIKIREKLNKQLSKLKKQLQPISSITSYINLKVKNPNLLQNIKSKTISIYAKLKTNNLSKLQSIKDKTVSIFVKLTNLDNVKSKIEDIKHRLLGLVPIITSLAVPLKSSMDFELQFVDVDKVFNGTKAQLNDIKKMIFDISASSSASVKDITAITAKGIGTGKIPLNDMKEFVKLASQSKVAFDLSSLDVGNAMDTVLSKLGYSVNNMRNLFDMLNYSTNISSSKMGEMLNVLKRTGGAMKSFKTEEIATLINFSVEKGVSPETTASSINSIVNSLKGLTKIKLDKLNFKGLDSGAVAFNKGKGYAYLYKILTKISKIKDPDLKFKTITDIFGKGEQKNLIENFLNDMQGFKKRYENISLKSNWTDSVKKEFEKVEATSLKKIEKFKGLMNILMIKIGDSFIKIFNKILDFINPILNKIVEFAKNNKKLFATILKVISVIGILLAGMLSLKLLVLGSSLVFGTLISTLASISSVVLGVISTISLPITALIGFIIALTTHWNNFKQGFINSIGAENIILISNSINNLIAYISNLWNIIKLTFSGLIDWLFKSNTSITSTKENVSLLGSVFQTLGSIIGMVFKGVITVIRTLGRWLDNIKSKIMWVINSISKIKLPNISNISSNIKNSIVSGYHKAGKVIGGLFGDNKQEVNKNVNHKWIAKDLTPITVNANSNNTVDLNLHSSNNNKIEVLRKSKRVNINNKSMD